MLFSDFIIDKISIFCKELIVFSFNNVDISTISVFLIKQLAKCMNSSCRWYRVQCSIFLDMSLNLKLCFNLSLTQWNILSYINIDIKISMLSWFSADVIFDQFQYPSTSDIWVWINERMYIIVGVIHQNNIFGLPFVHDNQSSWPKESNLVQMM